MAAGKEGNRGQNDTNAQIITTDNGRIYKPKDLLNAISEIQQFYVIESKGQNIPLNFSPWNAPWIFSRSASRVAFTRA